jgi:serine/threonine-protein kinase HipA
MYELGEQVIKSQSAVTGVQPKLSLHLEEDKNRNLPRIFTIVGLWGSYILKPPFDLYPGLPELEALTMRLSVASGIQTAPHALIRLSSGTLAYITKRVDRVQNRKLPMEDMCQLTERLTEHKYKGSYEQIVFSFLTGNADMHLKNFSLIKKPDTGWTLCPAYDMVPSALVMKDDPEELALNLNGKKRKIGMNDFRAAMEKCHIPQKAIDNLFQRFRGIDIKWNEIIRHSFISEPMKMAYSDLIAERIRKLDLKS